MRQLVKGKENSEFKPVKLRLKIDLVSYPAQAEGLVNMYIYCPVGWGCRIHRLHLCRGLRPPNDCPKFDTKQSDGEVPVMLELRGMQSTPSLPLLPGPLRPGTVAPDRALSMG